jgi:hypothetical protein
MSLMKKLELSDLEEESSHIGIKMVINWAHYVFGI